MKVGLERGSQIWTEGQKAFLEWDIPRDGLAKEKE